MATNAIKPSVVGPVLTDKADYILKALRDCRNHIKVLSDEIADLDLVAWDRHDTLEAMKAEAFVEAATEVNEQTGKLRNPNIDSQKAAAVLKLDATDYDDIDLDYHKVLTAIQKKKNTITCEHERRGDLRTEVELLKLLTAEAI
jgi:hypothetical protein